MAEAYYNPKYASEEAARRAGYTGNFGTGGADAWVAASEENKQALLDQFSILTNGGSPTADFNPLLDDLDLPVTDYMAQQIKNPNLPVEFVPTTQQVQTGEIQQAPQLNPTGQNIAAPAQVQAPTIANSQGAVATQYDPNVIYNMIDPTTGQMVPVTIAQSALPQMEAAQGEVSKEATVSGQLEELYNSFDGDEPPAWARGAIQQAEEAMAARGLGNSTLAGASIAEAIQRGAISIAATDAATFFQMDIQNLGNEQQARLENTRMKFQSLLTNTSIENAAKQFNAANASQVQQFIASTVTQIEMRNAELATGISQFNVAQDNQINATNAGNEFQARQFNAQMDNSVKQFNANLSNQREMFNNTNQIAIDQSNVQWRRSINTVNTELVNASMQANVQNAFNLSSTALNNLWQEYRDNASWVYESQQRQLDRDYNLMLASNNRQMYADLQDDAQSNALASAAGNVATRVIMNSFGGSDAGIGDIVDTVGNWFA